MNKINNLLLFLLLGIFVACSNPADSIDEDPYIIGSITEIKTNKILVEEDTTVNEPLEPRGKKIWLTLSDDTKIFRISKNGLIDIKNHHEFKKGLVIKGWTTEYIVTSYPAIGRATQIVFHK